MRWTPDNIARLRELIEAGHSAKSAASAMGATASTIYLRAHLSGIPIPKRSAAERAALVGHEMGDPNFAAYMFHSAREQLASEIAAAQREAPFALPYRGHTGDFT